MNATIQEKTVIVVPAGLERALEHLVTEYALAHKEEPEACRRAVEITVLQRGVAAVEQGLKANKELSAPEGPDAT